MEAGIEERIALGKEVVREQIEYFAAQFGHVASEWKIDGSRVTEADIHLSHVFADVIGEAFPDDQFFSEELDHGDEPIPVTAKFSWLLDPIDGTNNFARSIPNCSISLALLQGGYPVYGYVYDHATRKLIHGGKDRGAWIDDKPFKRGKAEISGQSLISIQSLADEDAMREENRLQMKFKLRAMGSSAIHMTYAALGWTDAVMAHRVKSWDIAGGVAIMQALGGSTRFFDTEVFPLREFNSRAVGFDHIAGMPDMCDAIEETIGRKSRFRI